MYPRPPTGTPTATREYYKRERQCIVVTASDPFPGEMSMALPMIRQGQLVGSEIENCRVDYRRVARMFSPVISSSFPKSFSINISILCYLCILTLLISLRAACGITFCYIAQPTSSFQRDIQLGRSLLLTHIYT